MSKLTIIADSTQIDAFDMCQRFHNYGYVENLELAGREEKDAMYMGSYGHKILEIYYKSLFEFGFDKSKALDKALSYRPTAEIPLHVGMANDDFHEAQNNNNTLKLDYAKWALVRDKCQLYTFKYLNSDMMPASPDHVEVGFSEKIYEDSDHLFVLEGRIDLLGELAGTDLVMDHKFQLRKKSLYKKSIQFRNYAMVLKKYMLIINYIRLTQKVDESTFERQIASFSPDEHEWWRGELIKIFFKMARAKETGVFDPSWSACTGKFGYTCPFTQLCEERNDDLRERNKAELYHVKEAWKPW